MKLYFIRHGETYLNKYKKMQGWADAPLTQSGEEVAVLTGKRLEDIKFAGVYSSDLGRTIKTAQIILDHNKQKEGVEIKSIRELRETFFGSFEGNNGLEVYKQMADNLGIPQEDIFKKLSLKEIADEMKKVDPTEDTESYDEFWNRILSGLKLITSDVEEKDEEKNILVVTHGNVIRSVVNYVDPSINVKREIANSSITILEYRDETYSVKDFNI